MRPAFLVVLMLVLSIVPVRMRVQDRSVTMEVLVNEVRCEE